MQARRDWVVPLSRNGCSWVGRVGVALALFVVGPAAGRAGELQGDQAPWRCPERDGVNCLYLQLRLLGYAGTYEAVGTAVPGGAERANLSGLAQAARRLGFALVPAKLSVAELACLASPTVILFEETELGQGRFHLLVEVSPTQVSLVDGGIVTRGERMSIDRFRRSWTGFALVSQAASPWPGRVLGLAAGAVTVAVAGWLARCTARGSRPRPGFASSGMSPFILEVE
jgi:hypothetical protein